MILDSSSGSNEKIYASFQLVSLVLDTDTTIYSDNSELIFMVLQFSKLIRDLNGKLPGWC